jgi:hypothetical protein
LLKLSVGAVAVAVVVELEMVMQQIVWAALVVVVVLEQD